MQGRTNFVNDFMFIWFYCNLKSVTCGDQKNKTSTKISIEIVQTMRKKCIIEFAREKSQYKLYHRWINFTLHLELLHYPIQLLTIQKLKTLRNLLWIPNELRLFDVSVAKDWTLIDCKHMIVTRKIFCLWCTCDNSEERSS